MLANTADAEEVTNYLRAFRLVQDNLHAKAWLFQRKSGSLQSVERIVPSHAG